MQAGKALRRASIYALCVESCVLRSPTHPAAGPGLARRAARARRSACFSVAQSIAKADMIQPAQPRRARAGPSYVPAARARATPRPPGPPARPCRPTGGRVTGRARPAARARAPRPPEARGGSPLHARAGAARQAPCGRCRCGLHRRRERPPCSARRTATARALARPRSCLRARAAVAPRPDTCRESVGRQWLRPAHGGRAPIRQPLRARPAR